MERHSLALNNISCSRGLRPSLRPPLSKPRYRCAQSASKSKEIRRPQRLLGRRGNVERLKLDRICVPSHPRRACQESLTRELVRNCEEDEMMLSGLNNEWDVSSKNSCVPLRQTRRGCPVFVMLPLDAVWVSTVEDSSISFLTKEDKLRRALEMFKKSGVEGIMVDIWWGICERSAPQVYDFTAYKRLFQLVSDAGLKIQAVLSFHAAGSNVGDTCKIPLPSWLLRVGEANPDIFYTDKQGFRNQECLSLGCDNERLFHGRTPVEMYKDFASAFVNTFRDLVGTVITEVTVGLGPAGELRYPSYPEGDGRWRFPGVGEFQCYDKYMLKNLYEAAERIGRPEWGHGGPHDAGHYNAYSWDTGFFNHWGSFQSEYGDFFLSWYSGLLIQHAERVLADISQVLNKAGERRVSRSLSRPYDGCWMQEFAPACHLGVKLAGVHWWFNTNSHAAELTAGYYNTRFHNGYEKIVERLKRFNVHVSFTCVEMRDCDHPPEAACSPQGLLAQVIDCCQRQKVRLAGENAVQRYDVYALGRIMESAFGENSRAGALDQITFLRMADGMFDNWAVFQSFLDQMKGTAVQTA